jgi:hypothetical protein
VLLFVVGLLAVVHGFQMIEEAFERLKTNPDDKLVVFYRSGEREGAEILETVRKAVVVRCRLRAVRLSRLPIERRCRATVMRRSASAW